MHLENIIKLRYLFTIAFGLIFFIGSQIIPATDTQQTWTFFEAIIGIVVFPLLQIFLFSDYIYNMLRDDGFTVSYKAYQLLGTVVAIGTFLLVFNVYIVGKGVNY